MNNTLLETCLQADGRYLSDPELQPLETYIRSFADRFNTYMLLKEKTDTLVLTTLRRLMQTKHRKAIQDHGAKCQRDMTATLEHISKALLLDDSKFLTEGYLVWMQNITRSLHKQDSATDAYEALREEINASFPPASVAVLAPYLEVTIQAFRDGM